MPLIPAVGRHRWISISSSLVCSPVSSTEPELQSEISSHVNTHHLATLPVCSQSRSSSLLSSSCTHPCSILNTVSSAETLPSSQSTEITLLLWTVQIPLSLELFANVHWHIIHIHSGRSQK